MHLEVIIPIRDDVVPLDDAKEKLKARQRSYYVKSKNKASVQSENYAKNRAYDRAYYEKNKEKIRLRRARYHMTYYAKNKEKLRLYNAEYRAKNKEKLRLSSAEYYAKIKEKLKEDQFSRRDAAGNPQ